MTQGFGWGWVALCIALAIHVLDEALTDFLSDYNPAVRAVRARFPFLPLPTFTFPIWLGGLTVVTLLLFALAPAAFRGAPGMRGAAYVFGIVMAGNGLLHIAGSLYMRRLMPGGYSAPLILAAAVYLLASVPRAASSDRSEYVPHADLHLPPRREILGLTEHHRQSPIDPASGSRVVAHQLQQEQGRWVQRRGTGLPPPLVDEVEHIVHVRRHFE